MLRIESQIKFKINMFWKLSFRTYFNFNFWISLPLRCQLVSSSLLLIPGLYLWSDVVLTCPCCVCNRIVSWPAAPRCWILCDYNFIVLLQLYMNVFFFLYFCHCNLHVIILNLIEINHLKFTQPFTKPNLPLKQPVFIQQERGIFFYYFSLGYTSSTPCLW